MFKLLTQSIEETFSDDRVNRGDTFRLLTQSIEETFTDH